MLTKKVGITFLFLVLWSFAFARPAYAYLDPGSGSYIFQLIVASLIGILFAVRLFWGKIKMFFKNIFSKQDSDEHNTES